MLTLFAVIATFVSCIACVRNLPSPTPPPGVGRTLQEQVTSSAEMRIACEALKPGTTRVQYGSLVMVNSTLALTALHVVRCATKDPDTEIVRYTEPLKIEANLGGNWYEVLVEWQVPDQDIAVLKTPSTNAQAAAFGELPALGQTACAAPSYPYAALRCGMVQPPIPEGTLIDTVVEPGNSGAGVYDASGRLVGIISQVRMCMNGQFCMAIARAVWPYRSVLLAPR